MYTGIVPPSGTSRSTGTVQSTGIVQYNLFVLWVVQYMYCTIHVESYMCSNTRTGIIGFVAFGEVNPILFILVVIVQ